MAKIVKKLYYSIGEVSEITGLKQYVLRYWESEFPSLSPMKNRAGNRVYRDKDIELIKFIKYLLYDKKYTIEGARQKLKDITNEDIKRFSETGERGELNDTGENSEYLLEIIRKIKKQLQEIAAILDSDK
jgi:DNA-binding transcriptional MerR regulator